MKPNFRILFLFVLSLMLPATIAAQTHRASLRGTVYDPNKAAVTGANVTVTSTDTGDIRTTTTDSNGQFAIASLPAGEYEVKVEAQAFRTHTEKFELFVNQEQRLDVDLLVGGTAYIVETPYTPLLKQDSASLGSVIRPFNNSFSWAMAWGLTLLKPNSSFRF